MGLKYNPFTGSFDFTGVAPSTLSNYVLKSGDTMTGALAVSPSTSQSVGSVVISQNTDNTTNGLSIKSSNGTNISRYWQNGTQLQINNNGYQLAWSNSGLLGINTTGPTHTITLPSTATGIALYNTPDQTTNYERGLFGFVSNDLVLQAMNAGTGTPRKLILRSSQGAGSSSITLFRNTFPFLNFDSSPSTAGSKTTFTGTATNSSGTLIDVAIAPTINQSSTASYTALLINPTHSATGSGAKLLTDWQVGGVSQVKIQSDGVFFPKQAVTASAPAYVLGGMYFDTTLNKLRIGGASGWETVTST